VLSESWTGLTREGGPDATWASGPRPR
jgi:hypothetical protein